MYYMYQHVFLVGVAVTGLTLPWSILHQSALPHQHFIQQLACDHQSDSGHGIRFTANQIPVHNITQCFHYNRNDQMVRKEYHL